MAGTCCLVRAAHRPRGGAARRRQRRALPRRGQARLRPRRRRGLRPLLQPRQVRPLTGCLMKFWQMLTWMEPEQILEVSRFAEEVGFAGVMLGDHGVFPREVRTRYPYSADGKPPMAPDSWYPDCWATIGAISAVTRRLCFSVAVYVLPLRNVFEVARASGTLAILSSNRFILGVGTGWMKEEFDIYGVDFHSRGKRFDEMLDALEKLWAGGMAEYHGQQVDFPALQISPAPSQPVPVYFGGASPRALRRAATRGQGWIGAGNTPEEVPAILAELKQ